MKSKTRNRMSFTTLLFRVLNERLQTQSTLSLTANSGGEPEKAVTPLPNIAADIPQAGMTTDQFVRRTLTRLTILSAKTTATVRLFSMK